jgi:hypothetical protein
MPQDGRVGHAFFTDPDGSDPMRRKRYSRRA